MNENKGSGFGGIWAFVKKLLFATPEEAAQSQALDGVDGASGSAAPAGSLKTRFANAITRHAYSSERNALCDAMPSLRFRLAEVRTKVPAELMPTYQVWLDAPQATRNGFARRLIMEQDRQQRFDLTGFGGWQIVALADGDSVAESIEEYVLFDTNQPAAKLYFEFVGELVDIPSQAAPAADATADVAASAPAPTSDGTAGRGTATRRTLILDDDPAHSWTVTVRGGGLPVFVVGSRAVVIGANDQADLRIDRSSVSGRHLSLQRLDDGSLQLLDLGSTNGTFGGGARLSAGVPFRVTGATAISLARPTGHADAVTLDLSPPSVSVGTPTADRKTQVLADSARPHASATVSGSVGVGAPLAPASETTVRPACPSATAVAAPSSQTDAAAQADAAMRAALAAERLPTVMQDTVVRMVSTSGAGGLHVLDLVSLPWTVAFDQHVDLLGANLGGVTLNFRQLIGAELLVEAMGDGLLRNGQPLSGVHLVSLANSVAAAHDVFSARGGERAFVLIMGPGAQSVDVEQKGYVAANVRQSSLPWK